MDIKDLKEKLVAVLGYGQEGRAITKYLIKHGVTPVLFDQKPWEQWTKEDQAAIKALKINFIFGPDAFLELKGFNVAFKSPGIPLTHPDLIKVKKLNITSQTKWFFEHCVAKIIGVTGTKGKGTTASLIYEILKKQLKIQNSKFKIYLTGNIGKDQPLDFLDVLTGNDWVVYELSSFQLQDLNHSPHVAVVLMVTSEHLDYHRNIAEYIKAKGAITAYQSANDFVIYNINYSVSKKIGELGKGHKIKLSRRQTLDKGCFIQDGWIVARGLDVLSGPTLGTHRGKYEISTLRQAQGSKILKTSDFELKGAHNLENVCAAVAAALLTGCETNTIKQVISKFKGLPHRLQLVAEKKGVKFYDDSISTTPETTVAAIASFNEPLIVILGGSSKNSDFSELGNAIKASGNVKSVILIGQESGQIKSMLGEFKGRIFENAKSMKEIFNQIKSVAKNDDVVLLSPACASFDMFKNYKDRGNQFKTLALLY